MKAARISLVCKSPLLLDGMAQAISARRDFSILARSELPAGAFKFRAIDQPDIWVLDLPGVDYIFDTISQIADHIGRPKVVVFSDHSSAEYVMRVLDAGATGYLTHGSAADELLECLHKVLRGETFITPLIATK